MTPTDVIADCILDNADDIATLSPRPMTWMNLDANVRHFIASHSIATLEAAGYRIVPQAALDELEQEARNGDCSYHFGWIVGWLDKHAPDIPASTAQEAK